MANRSRQEGVRRGDRAAAEKRPCASEEAYLASCLCVAGTHFRHALLDKSKCERANYPAHVEHLCRATAPQSVFCGRKHAKGSPALALRAPYVVRLVFVSLSVFMATAVSQLSEILIIKCLPYLSAFVSQYSYSAWGKITT